YLLVFQGGMATGSFGWGALAGAWGNGVALTVAALMLCLSTVAAVRWPLHKVQSLDLSPSSYWKEPELAVTPAPQDGPVLVTIEYLVEPEQARGFVEAMQRVGRIRRRTGAYRWGLFHDPANPERFLETFL